MRQRLQFKDWQQLVEALPECSAKASLRGIVAAAWVTEKPGGDGRETLIRMQRLVSEWREAQPAAELDRQLTAALRELIASEEMPVAL